MLKLLFADDSGQVYEHPDLLALAGEWLPRQPPGALHPDRRRHWDPATHSTPDLSRLVEERLARVQNPLLRQLARCALEYRCFTAQNTFYGRDEGAIPASAGCNARCVGCISDQPEDGPPASHERLSRAPGAGNMAHIGGEHLARAPGRTMVSFGQGCEGEPLT